MCKPTGQQSVSEMTEDSRSYCKRNYFVLQMLYASDTDSSPFAREHYVLILDAASMRIAPRSIQRLRRATETSQRSPNQPLLSQGLCTPALASTFSRRSALLRSPGHAPGMGGDLLGREPSPGPSASRSVPQVVAITVHLTFAVRAYELAKPGIAPWLLHCHGGAARSFHAG